MTIRTGLASLIALIALIAAGLYVQAGQPAAGNSALTGADRPSVSSASRAIPPEALETYEYAKANDWRTRSGYVGGSVFENREGRLPKDGAYREYDIHPARQGVNRGPERVVIDTRSGRGWYTGTHYGDAGEPAFIEIETK